MSAGRVAVILAGGAGLRMGGRKPLRAWGDVSLLARALSLAEGYADTVAVAVRDATQLGSEVGVPILLDHPAIPGPLAGLASALAFARVRGVSHVQVLACDMPRLPSDLALQLAVTMRSGALVGLPASNGQVHPICGLWSVKVEPLLTDYLAQGRSSLRGLAAAAGEAVADWGTIQPDPFVNLNTLEELGAQQPSPSELSVCRTASVLVGATTVADDTKA